MSRVIRKNGNQTRRSFIAKSGVLAAGLASPAILTRRVCAEAELEFRTLGETGLEVTAVGIGGSRTSEPSVISHAISSGLNFIDTGRMYAGGRNEEMIGRVIEDVRNDIIVQSKIDQKIHDDPSAMMQSIEDSLTALKTDYIDIMLLRGCSTEEKVKNDVAAEVFEKAKEQGKIRFCGFSTHTSEAHQMIRHGIDAGFYDVIMVPYNHAGSFHHTVYGIYSEWDQEKLESMFVEATDAGIGLVAMKTCSAGPMKAEDEPRGTYGAGLRWILDNSKHIGTMAVGMGSFSEVDEDAGIMNG